MLQIKHGQRWEVVEEPKYIGGVGAPHEHAIRSCLVTIPVRRRIAGRASQVRELAETTQYEQHTIFIDIDLTWLTRVLAAKASKTLTKHAVLACGAVRARLDRAPFAAPKGAGCALGVLADAPGENEMAEDDEGDEGDEGDEDDEEGENLADR